MSGQAAGKWTAIVMVIACVAFADRVVGQQPRRLIVAGQSGDIAVVETGGHFYVEIEALRQLLNGSLSLNGTHFVLSLSGSGADPKKTVHAEGEPAVSAGFSKEFLRSGIEQMSVIREWRTTLSNAVQRGFPVTEEWMASFRDRAQDGLRSVSVAASTESDRNALQLLRNEFNNMKRLSDRFVEAHKSRTYTPLDALQNDPLDRRILDCGHALAAMAANNQFLDEGSCR